MPSEHRPLPAEQPGPDISGRADGRARPGEHAARQGPHSRRAGGRRNGLPHHARHGCGRRVVRPRRVHRRWPHRLHRLAPRAEARRTANGRCESSTVPASARVIRTFRSTALPTTPPSSRCSATATCRRSIRARRRWRTSSSASRDGRWHDATRRDVRDRRAGAVPQRVLRRHRVRGGVLDRAPALAAGGRRGATPARGAPGEHCSSTRSIS